MGADRQEQRLDIFGDDMITAIEPGSGTGGLGQSDSTARRDSGADHGGITGGNNNPVDIIDDHRREMNLFLHDNPGGKELLVTDEGFDAAQIVTDAAAGDNLLFDRRGRVADSGGDQETIELRLRERESANLLPRILGRNDHKRIREGMGDPLDGHATLFHRLQKGTLGARHGAIEFIDEKNIAENRTGNKTKIIGSAIKDRQAGDIGWKEIAGTLHPPEVETGGAGESQSQGGLAETGTVFEE